jgi:hypothetical protein
LIEARLLPILIVFALTGIILALHKILGVAVSTVKYVVADDVLATVKAAVFVNAIDVVPPMNDVLPLLVMA